MGRIGWHEREKFNRTLPCSVLGCPNRRWGFKQLCDKHGKLRIKHGDPQGRAILPREYWKESEEVEYLLTKHAAHPVIVTAVNWFDELLRTAAGTNLKVVAKKQFRNLFDRGCTGRECLKVILSVYLLHLRRPDILPPGIRLRYAMSNSIFRLRPREERVPMGKAADPAHRRYRAIGKTAREELGDAIQSTLGALLVHCGEWLQDAQAKREKRHLVLKEPLELEGGANDGG